MSELCPNCPNRKIKINVSAIEKTASNVRFGVMAAVAPQKRQCKFGSLYPAGSLVGAATTPSRWDVVCHFRGDSATLKKM